MGHPTLWQSETRETQSGKAGEVICIGGQESIAVFDRLSSDPEVVVTRAWGAACVPDCCGEYTECCGGRPRYIQHGSSLNLAQIRSSGSPLGGIVTRFHTEGEFTKRNSGDKDGQIAGRRDDSVAIQLSGGKSNPDAAIEYHAHGSRTAWSNFALLSRSQRAPCRGVSRAPRPSSA